MYRDCQICGKPIDPRERFLRYHFECKSRNEQISDAVSQWRDNLLARLGGEEAYLEYERNGRWLRRFSRRHFISGLSSLVLSTLLAKQPGSGDDREEFHLGEVQQLRTAVARGDYGAASAGTAALLALKLSNYIRASCHEIQRDIGVQACGSDADSLNAAFYNLRTRAHSVVKEWVAADNACHAAFALVMRANIEVDNNPALEKGAFDLKQVLDFLEAADRLLDGFPEVDPQANAIRHQVLVRRILWKIAAGEARRVTKDELKELENLSATLDTPKVKQETYKTQAACSIATGDPSFAVDQLREARKLGGITLHRSLSLVRFEIEAHKKFGTRAGREYAQHLIDKNGQLFTKPQAVHTLRLARGWGVLNAASEFTPTPKIGAHIPFFYEEPLVIGKHLSVDKEHWKEN